MRNNVIHFVSLARFMTYRLLVATQEGYLYVYQVATVEGGECRLIIRHDLRTMEAKADLSTTTTSHTTDSDSMYYWD